MFNCTVTDTQITVEASVSFKLWDIKILLQNYYETI